MRTIRNWLTISDQGDEVSNQVARFLVVVEFTVLVTMLMVFPLSLVYRMYLTMSVVFIAVIILPICIWIARQGRVQLSSGLFLVTALVLTTLLLYLTGESIVDIGLLIFPILILVASMTLERKLYIGYILLSLASLFFINYAIIIGWKESTYLTYAGASRIVIDFIFVAMILTAIAILLRILTESLLRYIRLAQQRSQALAEKNVELQKEIAEREGAEIRVQQRRVMLENVVELGKTITQISDLTGCLQRIHSSVVDGLGFDRAGIFLYDRDQQVVHGSFGTDRDGKLVEMSQLIYPLDQFEGWKRVINNPKGYTVIENFSTIYHPAADSEMYGVGQNAAVAAWTGDKPVAVITVDNLFSGRPIEEVQLEGLRLLAGYIGMAIENARLHAELEERVLERTAQLEITNQELESFSYSVSHDLRSPLRAMDGYARLMSEEAAGQLTPDALNYLERIRQAARRMGQLIDDLLAFSRLIRKPLNLEIVHPGVLVRQVIEELQHAEESRQVTFHLGELPPCKADASLLRQVYVNLIGNALKYTSKRQEACIEIGSRQKNDKTVYYIQDNGVGFDMQYADKLFGVFQRLHREDEYEGSGIGLATAQRIIERHGGSIWAEAEVDRGATFYFTLE